MLDNESWARLLDGLILATKQGDLEWERRNSTSGNGVINDLGRSAVSALLGGQRVLQAVAKSAMYELTSDILGRAPFELIVWEQHGMRMKPIGSVKSSTMVDVPSTYQLNEKLAALFSLADASIEEPSAVVDRLLEDFS